jgi:hypothetical protein
VHSPETIPEELGLNGKRQGVAPTAASRGFSVTRICPIGARGTLYNHGEFPQNI